MVMTMTTMIVVYNSDGSSLAFRPSAAIIRATSPRETIPEPMVREDLVSNPVILAPNPDPISLDAIAKTDRMRRGSHCSNNPSNETVRPMLARKTGQITNRQQIPFFSRSAF